MLLPRKNLKRILKISSLAIAAAAACLYLGFIIKLAQGITPAPVYSAAAAQAAKLPDAGDLAGSEADCQIFSGDILNKHFPDQKFNTRKRYLLLRGLELIKITLDPDHSFFVDLLGGNCSSFVEIHCQNKPFTTAPELVRIYSLPDKYSQCKPISYRLKLKSAAAK